ncbi:MAG: DNA polymerase III subunit gamma/tau [Solirubrobacterales bacterium]
MSEAPKSQTNSPQQNSLYRRHRPRTFDDVIGQEHVVRTLRNAVDQQNVHHAYLFVGSRGTGKTSMAKILASALNAEGGPTSSFNADDPAAKSIAIGNSMDVVEMDAASHNGVDDIRELIDSVALAPTTGGWKVYILDEAHMITTQGWNAFLKTLEEPPPNTVFVLATTEANKVLPTVADRCHRFDFRRPSVEQLSQALRRAADAEQIEIGDDAVAMIARSATGSFRDALGTLEQLVTYGGTSVGAEDVQAVLGVADFELLCSTADAIASGDRRAVLSVVAELADSGRDLTAFARDLAVHVRNLLVANTLGETPPSIGLTEEQSERLVAQSSQFGGERAAHTLDLLSRTIQTARSGGDPRLQLELALFKAARPEDDDRPDALLSRIESLEQRAAGAAVTPTAPVVVPPTEVTDSEPTASRTPDAAAVQHPSPTAEAPPAVEAVATQAPALAVADSDPIAVPTIEIVESVWPNAILTLNDTSPRLGAVVESCKPLRIEDHRLVLGFPGSAGFQRKTAEQAAGRDTIADHIEQATGFRFTLVTEQISEEEFSPASDARPSGVDKDELVAQLKKEFDATELAEDRSKQ